MFALFGQVVSSEVLMASESGCPIERHDIRIKKCDPMYDRGCVGGRYMPFHRAMYDPTTGQSPNAPREQLNLVTSWIDGSFVYSTYEAWLNQMRSFRNGTLRVDHLTGYPPRNTQRVPLTNSPPAHHIKMISPERMFRKYFACALILI
jgi:dual oxidase